MIKCHICNKPNSDSYFIETLPETYWLCKKCFTRFESFMKFISYTEVDK